MSGNRPPVERQSIDEATREAESRALDFDPNLRARYIRDMLRDIPIWQNQGLTEDEIKEKIPQFHERYPELFRKIIQKQDLSPIQSMLAMLDRMGEGRLTQHQASVIIGQKLVDRYVTPQLKGNGSKQ